MKDLVPLATAIVWYGTERILSSCIQRCHLDGVCRRPMPRRTAARGITTLLSIN